MSAEDRNQPRMAELLFASVYGAAYVAERAAINAERREFAFYMTEEEVADRAHSEAWDVATEAAKAHGRNGKR